MRELTAYELGDVNGGIWNFVFGGLVGGGGYLVHMCMTGGSFNPGAFGGMIVGGAVTSGMSVLAGGGAGAMAYFGVIGTAAGSATQNAINTGRSI